MLGLRLIVFVALWSISCSLWATSNEHRISELDFQDITVGSALRILSKQAGLNIISSKAAAEIQMTMYLHDIEPMDVLEAMSKTYNLWYQADKQSKVIRVYTVTEFRLGKVDYRNEKTEIFTFKNQRTSLDFAHAISSLYGYQRVQFNQGATDFEVMNDLSSRMQRFQFIARNTSQNGVSGSSGTSGGQAGGLSGSNSGGSNNNQSNANNQNNQNNRGNQKSSGTQMSLQQGESLDLLKLLPERESQAMLSGQHKSSTRALNALIEHISPIYVTLVRRQNRVLVRTRDKDAMWEIKNLFKQLNIDMATVLLEVKVLQLDLSDGYESSFEFNVKSGSTGGARGGTGFVSSATNASSSIGQLIGASVGDPAMVAAVVSKNFQMRLRLLENEGRVTELATPMLTTSNQEVSSIFIGEERPITTSMSVTCPQLAQTNGNGGTANQSVCISAPNTVIRKIGKTLLLTPNISANGTVDIRLLVDDSSVCPNCGTIPFSNGFGGLGSTKVDTVLTQTFSGDIIAKNGQMIAVGGLINERTSDVEKKVPVLGDIPYLGALFSDIQKVRKRTEMVILIRPFVMNQKGMSDVNQRWLESNSLHPSADWENHLDIYKNDKHADKGYELQPNYKVYQGQDTFDGFHEKGEGAQGTPVTAQPQ